MAGHGDERGGSDRAASPQPLLPARRAVAPPRHCRPGKACNTRRRQSKPTVPFEHRPLVAAHAFMGGEHPSTGARSHRHPGTKPKQPHDRPAQERGFASDTQEFDDRANPKQCDGEVQHDGMQAAQELRQRLHEWETVAAPQERRRRELKRKCGKTGYMWDMDLAAASSIIFRYFAGSLPKSFTQSLQQNRTKWSGLPSSL